MRVFSPARFSSPSSSLQRTPLVAQGGVSTEQLLTLRAQSLLHAPQFIQFSFKGGARARQVCRLALSRGELRLPCARASALSASRNAGTSL